MRSFLDRKNKEIEKRIGYDAVIKGTSAIEDFDVFEKYEKCLESKESIQVSFSSCGRDGTFVGMDENNVHLVMAGNLTIEHLPYFKPSLASKLVGYDFDVKVIKVDREKRRVYVESARNSPRATKNTIINELKQALERGEQPEVWGKVRYVKDNRAYIDIVGEHVLGIISVKYWQKTYLRYLETVCKPDEFYSFRVTAAAAERKGKDTAFFLNRQDLADDPWENVPMDIVKRGAIIFVKCIENPQGIAHWWGSSNIAPGIEILGLFPNKPNTLDILPDLTYKCRIQSIRRASDNDNHGDNVFVVVPFAVSDEDKIAYEKYRTLKATRLSMDATDGDVELPADEGMGQDDMQASSASGTTILTGDDIRGTVDENEC